MTYRPKKETYITTPAAKVVAGDGTRFLINGTCRTIVDVTPGPVWYDDKHSALMCPEGDLFVTLDNGFRVAAHPTTEFIVWWWEGQPQ